MSDELENYRQNKVLKLCREAQELWKPSELAAPAGSDLRSPLAQARDEWMQSEEGEMCCKACILKSPDLADFLRNRLETAFLAGVAWGQKNPNDRAMP